MPLPMPDLQDVPRALRALHDQLSVLRARRRLRLIHEDHNDDARGLRP